MAYRDLREWIDAAERHGELKHISGADSDLEMSGIAEIAVKEAKGPVPLLLFDRIPGYPETYRTLFSLLATPWRVATALGLPEGITSPMALMQGWRRKIRELHPIAPRSVASGPVQANRMTGNKIDLFQFPSPRFHELDGGRYIGTAHVVILRDPDSGWVNLGTYRCMLVAEDRIALHISEGQHGRMIMDEKYFRRGRTMPVAIAIGVDPTLWFTSTYHGVPWGMSEYDYAGGIKGEPIEVIAGPNTGLPLPAHSEIVIEGECHPGELVDEGPFGEWHGYYANLGLSPVPEPVIRVKTVLYRDDPVLTCSHPCVPPHDHSLIRSVSLSAETCNYLERAGIPGIRSAWCHEAGGGILFDVISIEQMYAGHATEVGVMASQRKRSVGRYTIVVDEDIDPSNLDEVVWAMSTRSDPERSIQIIKRCRSASPDPAISPEEKRRIKVAPKPLFGSRAIIDACRPYEWKNEFYPVARASPELRLRLLAKWEGLFGELGVHPR